MQIKPKLVENLVMQIRRISLSKLISLCQNHFQERKQMERIVVFFEVNLENFVKT